MTYVGKYVGYVRDADDPLHRGRLRMYVPEVLGEQDDADHWTDWALPCFPWVVNRGVGDIFVPPAGNTWGVWVEFRQGDLRFPIWVGVFPLSGSLDTSKLVLVSPAIELAEAGASAAIGRVGDSVRVTIPPGTVHITNPTPPFVPPTIPNPLPIILDGTITSGSPKVTSG